MNHCGSKSWEGFVEQMAVVNRNFQTLVKHLPSYNSDKIMGNTLCLVIDQAV